MKKTIEKIENMIEGWLNRVPHLPESFKKWLSTNLWIIVLVGTILSGIAIISMFAGLLAIISMLGAATRMYYGYYAVASYSGWSVFTSLLSIIFVVGTVILMALAINPLKAGNKSGWQMLFYSLLLQAVAVVVNAVLSFNVISIFFGLIFGAIGVAVGAYLLFEVKSHFVKSGKVLSEKIEKDGK